MASKEPSPVPVAATPVAPEARGVTPEEFRDVIGRFASGVTVITARHAGDPLGATASAVSSLSLEPPMLLVCLKQGSATGRAISASGRFAVNVLGEDHADHAVRFAARAADRFAQVRWTEGTGGLPLLDDALARIECRVAEEVAAGTHTVFLAEVERASARPGAPLAYFRGQFGRLELAHDRSAFEELRSRVLRREVASGEPLEIDAQAARLDVPRGSVYQALVKLAADGLVDRDADGAFRVRPVTLETVMGSVHARYAMLVGAAALTAGTASDEEIAELRALAEAAARPPAPSDAATWVRARAAFGEGFLVASRGSAALDAFRRADVPALILALWAHGAPPATELERFRRGFVGLVDAYAAGDLEALTARARDIVALYGELYGRAFAGQREI
jgi:flavin reductase (DIM6/NTAB) family NADH-FMN oxidoreductase RutF/DNA-binding FadR family transcriptional regulator